LLDGPAQGNGVVVKRLLSQKAIDVPLRTLQRALAPRRREKHAAQVAAVRFETRPGEQMQIDFGEKRVQVATSGVMSVKVGWARIAMSWPPCRWLSVTNQMPLCCGRRCTSQRTWRPSDARHRGW
jgi:hypothetical protein